MRPRVLAAARVQIVMTGYCQVIADLPECDGQSLNPNLDPNPDPEPNPNPDPDPDPDPPPMAVG